MIYKYILKFLFPFIIFMIILSACGSVTPTIIAKQNNPTPTPDYLNYLNALISIKGPGITGKRIEMDASALKKEFGETLTFAWQQMRMPDQYKGKEYLSGNVVELENLASEVAAFTPQYPGLYKFQLELTNAANKYVLFIQVPVRLSKEFFGITGFALGNWSFLTERVQVATLLNNYTRQLGGKVIMINPTWYMSSTSANTVESCPLNKYDPKICVGVMTDEELLEIIRDAHSQGLQVMIKPILNIAGSDGPEWPNIKPENWGVWFANWTQILVNYGKIAENEKVEFLALGNELRTTTQYIDLWKQLIQQVRLVYSGKLTYGDNSFGYDGWGEFKLWDKLDYIGVHLWGPGSGKYGVSKSSNPSVEEMARTLDGQLSEFLDPVVKKFDKPVLILEVGTGNYDGTNLTHWEWNDILDNGEQAEYIEAAMRVFAARPNIKGVFYWALDWYDYYDTNQQTSDPRNKPLEEVLNYWFKVS